MTAHLEAVDEHGRVPIDGAEMEQKTLSVPRFRDSERTPVPDPVVLVHSFHHAGKSRLDREGDENSFFEFLGPGRVLAGDCQVPEPVEIEPRVARHLGTRILGKHTLRRDLVRPACRQPSRTDCPFRFRIDRCLLAHDCLAQDRENHEALRGQQESCLVVHRIS